jgi:hypothetical protein
MDVPQPIADALQTALQARADLDAAQANQVTTGAALVASQQADTAAQADVQAKVSSLASARLLLEQLEDAYLQPGGQLPSAAPVTPASPPASSPPPATPPVDPTAATAQVAA